MLAIILIIMTWFLLALLILDFFKGCNDKLDKLIDKSEYKKGDENV